MQNFLVEFFKSVFPNPNYRAVVIPLAVIILVLGLFVILPNLSATRFHRLRDHQSNLVLGIVIVTLLVMVMAVGIPNRWQWIVGLLPTLMVGYQLFFLWLYHPREITAGGGANSRGARQWPQVDKQSYQRAVETIDNHFNLKTLFTRYGLPAVLLGITGIVISDILVQPENFFSVTQFAGVNNEMILRGVRLGAVGAYVYVLLELGRRTFRHDITGASAMWCWVTLVLGPLLAGTVSFLWRTDAAQNTPGWWGTGVVLFFTGFAPRRVIAAVEQAAAQLLKLGPTTVVDTRLIPLSKIRGISPQIEERLGEEGIVDVNSLASAEPVRLVRNTSFDMKQILSWIDEAILIVTLPRGWEGLEEEGITGAIDLAWYAKQLKFDPETGAALPVAPGGEIDNLSKKAKFENPANMVATIRRLSEDTQVRYIWALYNNFTEYSGGDQKKSEGDDQAEPNTGESVSDF